MLCEGGERVQDFVALSAGYSLRAQDNGFVTADVMHRRCFDSHSDVLGVVSAQRDWIKAETDEVEQEAAKVF